MSDQAIHAWVVAATGLAESQVIWENQPGPRPAPPWISLLTIDDGAEGQDSLSVVDDEPNGGDILHRQDGLRRRVISVQCFAEPTGADHPVRVLRRLRSRLPTAIAPLEAVADLSQPLVGGINDISALVGDAERESRAQVDVVFYESEHLQEAGVSIDSVEINLTSPVVDQFTVEIDPA